MKTTGSTLLKFAVPLFLLAILGLAVRVHKPAAAPLAPIPVPVSTQPVPAGTTPADRLLRLTDLEYIGAFRVPDGHFGSPNGFNFGGTPLAYNPTNNSLFIGGHPYDSMIAEINIPTPVNRANTSALPVARLLQPFADPTEGGSARLLSPGSLIVLGGLLVSGSDLYGTVYVYYDANNEQRASHYRRSAKLNEAGGSTLQSVWEPESTGYVSGYLAAVPSEWQARLGGPAITGQCCIPIVSRTSWGPSAFAWNPADLGKKKPVPATPLVYYTEEHPTLGPWEGAGSAYGGTTMMGGVALVSGTRTALFFGSNGTGKFCYGPGTSNPAQVDKPMPGSPLTYCYDPLRLDEGTHAYPYVFQIWAYDLNDWSAVKAGKKQPWDVKPYGVWPFQLPTSGEFQIGGVGYDAERRIIYLSQLHADGSDEISRPIVHAFQVR